jgi:hemerythrin-like domain-containing protein
MKQNAPHGAAPRPPIAPELALDTRTGLPDALVALLADLPRAEWERHPNFGELVRFWLERHLMFRQLLDQIRADTEAAYEKRLAPETHGPRLARYGGFFLQQLHGHHQIEDHHYFPRLAALDERLASGFDLLDADHHALDGLLAGFAEGANAVLAASGDAARRDATGRFHEQLREAARLLGRHLEDEEDLIVPVILRSGFSG